MLLSKGAEEFNFVGDGRSIQNLLLSQKDVTFFFADDERDRESKKSIARAVLYI